MDLTTEEWNQILDEFYISTPQNICPIDSGLINHTWRINEDFIVQRINTEVFRDTALLENNVEVLVNHFSTHFPKYFFAQPIKNKQGKYFLKNASGDIFRISMYVSNSICYNSVKSAGQSYEAAKKFGEFSRLLSSIKANSLGETIPDFHNLSLRFIQFLNAIQTGNSERIKNANAQIKFILSHQEIVKRYEYLLHHREVKLRIAHHDTKISNVLFNKSDQAICVIDWDTVMPGYFWSDVGDMMRTYLSAVNEEEKDLQAIEIRNEYFEGIYEGYMEEMGHQLSKIEKEHFVFAGILMIYMQAMRFLTDYLMDDIYYGQKYEGHNFVRAMNQIELLSQLLKKQKDFK